MPFRLFEFVERFISGAFSIILTHFEKTGQQVKFLFSRKSKS